MEPPSSAVYMRVATSIAEELIPGHFAYIKDQPTESDNCVPLLKSTSMLDRAPLVTLKRPSDLSQPIGLVYESPQLNLSEIDNDKFKAVALCVSGVATVTQPFVSDASAITPRPGRYIEPNNDVLEEIPHLICTNQRTNNTIGLILEYYAIPMPPLNTPAARVLLL